MQSSEQAPEGFRYVAVEDRDWLLGSGAERRCRHNSRHSRCDNPVVARFQRGGSGWWWYCADHMYGRWIEDGKVMHWILQEATND